MIRLQEPQAVPVMCESAVFLGLEACTLHELPLDTAVRCSRAEHGHEGHFDVILSWVTGRPLRFTWRTTA